jgi:O-antigen ligase
VDGLPWIPEGVLAAHNVYLQLLAETGICGFAAFASFIYLATREAWRQWSAARSDLGRALAFGVLGAIVALLVHGFVDFLFTPQFETLFWTLLALLVANASVEARERPTGTRVVTT